MTTSRLAGLATSASILAAVLSGCGSSSPSDTRHMTWSQNGTAVKTVGQVATRTVSGDQDSLEVIGLAASSTLTLFVSATAPLTPQMFVCGQTTTGQNVNISYDEADGGSTFAMQTCSVNLTQAGAAGGGSPAKGTFAATFSDGAGATRTITDGSFNVPPM